MFVSSGEEPKPTANPKPAPAPEPMPPPDTSRPTIPIKPRPELGDYQTEGQKKPPEHK